MIPYIFPKHLLFLSFSNKYLFYQQINVKMFIQYRYSAGIRTHNLQHESPPITARPAANLIKIYACKLRL